MKYLVIFGLLAWFVVGLITAVLWGQLCRYGHGPHVR